MLPGIEEETAMAQTGRCYCGELRYDAGGAPMFAAQCHCRECQYISGGGPNFVVGMPSAEFRYTKGAPKVFRRADLERPAAREFCPECGTHVLTRVASNEAMVVLKVGTLDDQDAFAGPQMAIWTDDKRPWHAIPEGATTFPRFPGG
jgi:hypothetical protein